MQVMLLVLALSIDKPANDFNVLIKYDNSYSQYVVPGYDCRTAVWYGDVPYYKHYMANGKYYLYKLLPKGRVEQSHHYTWAPGTDDPKILNYYKDQQRWHPVP